MMGYTVSRIFTILSAFDSWFMEPWVDTGISAKRTSQKARNLGKLGFGLKELVSISGSFNGCLQSETVQSVYMHRDRKSVVCSSDLVNLILPC